MSVVALLCARATAVPCQAVNCSSRFRQERCPVAAEQSPGPFADPPAEVQALFFGSASSDTRKSQGGKEEETLSEQKEFPGAFLFCAAFWCGESGSAKSFSCFSRNPPWRCRAPSEG